MTTEHPSSKREQLREALRSRWYLMPEEIDAILADREFFQPYLRESIANRAKLGCVPEDPVDATDSQAIFILTELNDTRIIPDLLECLKMDETDLNLTYGDMLTEDMWLPFAKLGYDYLDEMWKFVTDSDIDLFARLSPIAGIIAMHHFHPDRRADSVAFIERLLNRNDCFPDDELAAILCDCAESGLMELAERAKEFAENMEYDESAFVVAATKDEVFEAFRDGPQEDFISRRPHNVYMVNKVYQDFIEKQEKANKYYDVREDDGGNEEFINAKDYKAQKVGRNDPCPCGSGKKYKKCCGA